MTTNPLRADELRERFSKQHEKWLIGTDDDAEAAQEWCMENLPSLLALLTPPPSLASVVAEIDGLVQKKRKLSLKAIDALDVFFPSPMCRDCADNDGTCPSFSGRPCDPEDAKKWARQVRDQVTDGLLEPFEPLLDQLRTALTISGTGWRDISTAPKKPAAGSNYWGPKILINTEHHGYRMTFIGRYHHGVHKRFMDTADGSCVTAGDEGDLWMPLPQPKTGDA